MPLPSQQRMQAIVAQLREAPELPGSLPGEDAAIVQEPLAGQDVYTIAQQHEISTEAVWAILGQAAREASGHEPAQRVETGGLGSDTDPGVTGGYGETGFGSLGTEPPLVTPEEPRERPAGPATEDSAREQAR